MQLFKPNTSAYFSNCGFLKTKECWIYIIQNDFHKKIKIETMLRTSGGKSSLIKLSKREFKFYSETPMTYSMFLFQGKDSVCLALTLWGPI